MDDTMKINLCKGKNIGWKNRMRGKMSKIRGEANEKMRNRREHYDRKKE